MKTIEYTIKDALGIHARPAGLLVKEAGKFASKIMIASPKKEVDAKRIMGVMSLGVKCGDTVKITIEGEDEETAAAAMQAFLESNSRVICKDFISLGVNGDEIGGRKRSSALPSVNTIGRFGGPQNKEGKLL